MTDPGYYDQSIPPALLVGSARRAAGSTPAAGVAARTAPAAQADQQPSPLLVRAGAPAVYEPAGKAAHRPRNVTELNTAGAVAEPASPWTAGQYVPVGISGKRAHWNGEEWRGGESPGYPATAAQEEAPPVETRELPRHAAPEEPGAFDAVADDDMPKDAARMSPPPLPAAPYPRFPGDEKPGDLTR